MQHVIENAGLAGSVPAAPRPLIQQAKPQEHDGWRNGDG